jgi:hypothetical protein
MPSNQSGFIFGFILLAFFVYITLKGELPIYAGLLLLSPGGTGSSSASSAQQQTTDAAQSQLGQAALEAGFAAFGL